MKISIRKLPTFHYSPTDFLDYIFLYSIFKPRLLPVLIMISKIIQRMDGNISFTLKVT